MIEVYKIVHKDGWLAACDFYGIERAQAWLEKFDPRMYSDKTLKREDFTIVRTK
jgi:hypothetical protein